MLYTLRPFIKLTFTLLKDPCYTQHTQTLTCIRTRYSPSGRRPQSICSHINRKLRQHNEAATKVAKDSRTSGRRSCGQHGPSHHNHSLVTQLVLMRHTAYHVPRTKQRSHHASSSSGLNLSKTATTRAYNSVRTKKTAHMHCARACLRVYFSATQHRARRWLSSQPRLNEDTAVGAAAKAAVE